LQYSPIPPDHEKFNPYAIEDLLPDFERERLSTLKLELIELRKERMALVEAGLQRYQALTKKADALMEHMIESLNLLSTENQASARILSLFSLRYCYIGAN
jgi:hypothetical protein